MEKEEIVALIMKSPADVWIKIDHLIYYEVKFDKDDFCWAARCNYPYGGGLIFPMKSTNLVKTFKTLNGSKRNFIRKLYPKEI